MATNRQLVTRAKRNDPAIRICRSCLKMPYRPRLRRTSFQPICFCSSFAVAFHFHRFFSITSTVLYLHNTWLAQLNVRAQVAYIRSLPRPRQSNNRSNTFRKTNHPQKSKCFSQDQSSFLPSWVSRPRSRPLRLHRAACQQAQRPLEETHRQEWPQHTSSKSVDRMAPSSSLQTTSRPRQENSFSSNSTPRYVNMA
jgi:hypothetical protein